MCLQGIIKDCKEDKQTTLFFSCGRAREKTEGKKSKYTEWEREDKSWDSLLIWFPSNSGKQHTAEWINFLITLCLMSVHSRWAPSPCYVLEAAPACPSSPPSAPWQHLLHSFLPQGPEPTDCPRFAPCGCLGWPWLHITVSICLPLAWKLGWGNTSPSPAGLLQKGKGNFFCPQLRCPLGNLSTRQRPPLGPGTAGQVRASGKTMVGKTRSCLYLLLTESLGYHILAYSYNHWLHAVCLYCICIKVA